MKICVIGAPSTGKSVFSRKLASQMGESGQSCELVQEYASSYIQQVGAPVYAWEQLIISIGQYLAEQKTTRHHMVTDAAAFVTYVYAQRLLPSKVDGENWPRYRHLLDVLRQTARISVQSYDVIFFLTHIFPPTNDGVRLQEHLSLEECQGLSADIEAYLRAERAVYYPIDVTKADVMSNALHIIEKQNHKVQV